MQCKERGEALVQVRDMYRGMFERIPQNAYAIQSELEVRSLRHIMIMLSITILYAV
jgi:hypothetical protein